MVRALCGVCAFACIAGAVAVRVFDPQPLELVLLGLGIFYGWLALKGAR